MTVFSIIKDWLQDHLFPQLSEIALPICFLQTRPSPVFLTALWQSSATLRLTGMQSAGREAAVSAVLQEGAHIQGGPQGGPCNRSIWPVHQSQSHTLPKKAEPVHHKCIESGSDVEDEVHGIQVVWPKHSKLQPTRRLPCASCGESPDWKSCKFHYAECQACGKRWKIACACRVIKSRMSLPQSFWVSSCVR